MSEAYEPRLKRQYREQIRQKMQDQFQYSNPMQVPKLDKVVLNMGVGEAVATPRRSSLRLPNSSALPVRSRWPRARVNPLPASSCVRAC